MEQPFKKNDNYDNPILNLNISSNKDIKNKKIPLFSLNFNNQQVSFKPKRNSTEDANSEKQDIFNSVFNNILKDNTINDGNELKVYPTIETIPNQFSENKKKEANLFSNKDQHKNSLESTIKKIQEKKEFIPKQSEYVKKDANVKLNVYSNEFKSEIVQNPFLSMNAKENVGPVLSKFGQIKDSDVCSIARKASQEISNYFITFIINCPRLCQR